MASRPPASSPRRSWRQAPGRPAAAPAAGSKAPLRWILALAVVALLAGFAWLIWQPARPEPSTHFVALVSGESDRLSVPPILFEEATLAPLKQAAAAGETLKYVDASAAQAAGDASAIAAQLRDLAIDKQDRLIVYVSAHGVSDDGVAYVLARDYDLRSPQRGRYPAAELIKAVAALDAAAKLLVFDCSRMAVHPRMGMAANEFAALVEAAAQGVDDPRLAIVLAGGELATSPMGLVGRRSVLGGALVDALLGDADLTDHGGNDDRNVSLAELREFVIAGCAKSPVAAPVPRFLACGEVSSLRGLDGQSLLWLPKVRGTKALAELADKATAKKQEGDKKPAVSATAGSEPEKPGSAPQVAAAPAAPAASGTPPVAPSDQPAAPAAAKQLAADATAASPTADGTPAAGAEPPPAESAPAAAATAPTPVVDDAPPIIQAWRLRDRLSGLDSSIDESAAMPADYAPQLWSELGAMLVSLHLEQLGRAASNAAAPADRGEQLGPYLRGLQRLADGTPSTGDGLVTDQLGDARAAYQRSGARQKMATLDPRYVQAALDLRRHLAAASQFVEWHAAALGSSADAAAAETARAIEHYIEALETLDRRLAEFEQTRFGSWSEASPALGSLDEARNAVRAVASQLADRIRIEVDAIAHSGDAAAQRELESLLATDAATADQRETLLATLRRTGGNAEPRPAGRLSWDAVIDHLGLEVRLVQLADPALRESPPLQQVLAALQSAGGGDDGRRRIARDAGQALRQFYADLPARVTRLRQSSATPDDARTAERLVALLHPRDASALSGPGVGSIAFRLEPPTEIVLTPPPLADLVEGETTTLEWTLRLSNAPGAKVTATLADFDARALDVRFPGAAEAATAGDSQAYEAVGELKIALAVRPKSTVIGTIDARTRGVTLRVAATTNAGPLEAANEARVVIPSPNRIDIVAYTVEPPLTHDEQRRTQSVELQPYPNRSTTFQIGLANHADRAKRVRVELIAVPMLQGPSEPFVDGGWPPGRLLDEYGQTPQRLKAWAATGLASAPVIALADLELPPDGRPRQAVLTPPASEAPAEPPAEPPAEGAEAPPPPKPPASVDVTHGLVCRIVDQDRPADVALKWVEVVPLRPTSYFDADAQLAGREVRFSARPTDANDDGRRDLPPEIVENPVQFVIRGDGTVFPAGRVVPDVFVANKSQAQLDVQPLASVRGRHTVGVDVDGVPRAVLWNVDFEQQTVRLNDSPASVRIMRVGMPPANPTPARMFRTTPYVEFPLIDPKVWPTVVDVGPDRVCSFDVSRGVRPPLELRLQVDAPWDAFNTVGDGSAVIVSWGDGAEGSHNLYHDRAVRCEIVKFNDDGAFAVKSTVDDLAFSMFPPGVNNKVVTLSARLSVQGVERDADSLRIVFDQSPPTIESAVAPAKVWQGTKDFDVRMVVVDLSSIDRVEAWFTAQRLRGVDELDPKKADVLPIPDTAPFQPETEVERTLDLKAPTPKDLGAYYLTFRVTDRSGQSSDTLATPLLIEVAEKPKPVVGPVVGDLKGQILLGTKPAPAGFTVTAKENPALTGASDGTGKFVIKAMPAGKYTLIVEGRVNSRPVVGEQEVTLEKPEDYQGKVVKAAVEWADPPKDK